MAHEKAGIGDTAIFYSINNTQNGLARLGLGKMLIGKVVEYLIGEKKEIKQFATLSPLPRFWKNYLYTSSWLSKIQRSFRWFDKMEIKGMFSRQR